MESEGWEISEVAGKVDHEGGIFDALQWGLRSEVIADPELRLLWAKVEELYEQMRPSIDRIYEIFDANPYEDDY